MQTSHAMYRSIPLAVAIKVGLLIVVSVAGPVGAVDTVAYDRPESDDGGVSGGGSMG